MADYGRHYDNEPRRPEREGSAPRWVRRERGGYWRDYVPQGTYAVRGHNHTAAPYVTQASGKGTPSKSSGTTT